MFHKFQTYFTDFQKLDQHMGDFSVTSSLLYLPEPVKSLRSYHQPSYRGSTRNARAGEWFLRAVRNLLGVLLANYLGVVGAPPPLLNSMRLCLASRVVLGASFGSSLWRNLGPFGYVETN
jgi:hypothetical protein